MTAGVCHSGVRAHMHDGLRKRCVAVEHCPCFLQDVAKKRRRRCGLRGLMHRQEGHGRDAPLDRELILTTKESRSKVSSCGAQGTPPVRRRTLREIGSPCSSPTTLPVALKMASSSRALTSASSSQKSVRQHTCKMDQLEFDQGPSRDKRTDSPVGGSPRRATRTRGRPLPNTTSQQPSHSRDPSHPCE